LVGATITLQVITKSTMPRIGDGIRGWRYPGEHDLT